MKTSRREFIVAGTTGVAGLYAGGLLPTRLVAAGAEVPSSTAPVNALPPEDGYKLWLRHAAPPAETAQAAKSFFRRVQVEGETPTSVVARAELNVALATMFGPGAPSSAQPPSQAPGLNRVLLVGTPATSTFIADLAKNSWAFDLARLGPEGFLIRSGEGKIPANAQQGTPAVIIAAVGEIGALYGVYHFLRLLQTGHPIVNLDIVERPKLQLRLLNHWDNLDGSIERGYAGKSLWQWAELPGKLNRRYEDYARANAAIGINGAVINNVNADARSLSAEYLAKAAALANVWRPYGVRLYLSVRFSAPTAKELPGALATADPLDPKVIAWWKAKADEIYNVIPDFGGFLVKANSEGQPGPKDYNRTHAEGANCLAAALAPHGGNVIWRAFVYDDNIDPDRVKRAYIEFTALEGKFHPNVLIQVKNGPLDFQPREPFHPLFGAMKTTPCLAEVQPTQEYLGQAKHLVYLGTMWEEFLQSDTQAKGPGSTVGKCIDGTIYPYSVTGMVGVTNPGLDTNWCGHHFSQANWYSLGRLAWNHELSAKSIAEEWIRLTFTNDEKTVATIRDFMLTSRETYLNYTMPLGLHHMIGGDHYAPMPQNAGGPRPDWTAVYYHKAAADGIGFDRTKTGDNYVGQYFPPVGDRFNDIATCPETFLLWFHRCAWDYKCKSGKPLWTELCDHYYHGIQQATAMQATWLTLAGQIDPRRHQEVADRLAIQVRDATRWRDQILTYFQRFSNRPIAATSAG